MNKYNDTIDTHNQLIQLGKEISKKEKYEKNKKKFLKKH